MAESNHAPVPSCSKFNPNFEDEIQLKEASVTKFIETANRRSNFLQDLDDRINSISQKAVIGVPSDTFALRCQQPCQNVSFKSLPPLGAKDSLENILRIRRYGEFPRRNLLRSFVKANNLEKRPRRRLCQNKAETEARSNEPSTLKGETCPEVNVKKVRYQLAKERKVFNRFSIGRFGQNIKNRIRGEALMGQFSNLASHQGLSYDEVVSLGKDEANNLQILSNNSKTSRSNCNSNRDEDGRESKSQANKLLSIPNESYSSMEMLDSLEKLHLNPAERKATVRLGLAGSSQIPENEVDLKLTKNDLSTWLKDVLINETNSVEERTDQRKSEFQQLNEMKCKVVNLPSMKEAKENSFIHLQSCPSRVDFSCGDDTRNLTLDGACVEEENTNQDYESRRRSVQWNSEVDVIYYAGDTDGGKIIRRKIEPLREEADQQARRNGFIKLSLKKNMISAFNTQKFQDSWVTVYHKL